jgi:hypothetical protein
MKFPGGHYILDNDGEPREERNLLKWARWFESSAEARRVARDDLGAAGEVSTVFLGLDHNFSDDPRPVLWESMVFGGPLDMEVVRYRSREKAVGGHMLLVEQLRALEVAPGAPEEQR